MGLKVKIQLKQILCNILEKYISQEQNIKGTPALSPLYKERVLNTLEQHTTPATVIQLHRSG